MTRSSHSSICGTIMGNGSMVRKDQGCVCDSSPRTHRFSQPCNYWQFLILLVSGMPRIGGSAPARPVTRREMITSTSLLVRHSDRWYKGWPIQIRALRKSFHHQAPGTTTASIKSVSCASKPSTFQLRRISLLLPSTRESAVLTILRSRSGTCQPT